MVNEHEGWLKKAKSNLDAANYNLKGKGFDVAAFYSQQAAEKALKALYIKRRKELFKTHDLVFLSKELDAPKEIIDMCGELTPAYVFTRYPDSVSDKNLDSLAEE